MRAIQRILRGRRRLWTPDRSPAGRILSSFRFVFTIGCPVRVLYPATEAQPEEKDLIGIRKTFRTSVAALALAAAALALFAVACGSSDSEPTEPTSAQEPSALEVSDSASQDDVASGSGSTASQSDGDSMASDHDTDDDDGDSMSSGHDVDDADDAMASQDDMDEEDDGEAVTTQDDASEDAGEAVTTQEDVTEDSTVEPASVKIGTGVGEMPPDYYILDLEHKEITQQDQLATGRPVFYYFFTTW